MRAFAVPDTKRQPTRVWQPPREGRAREQDVVPQTDREGEGFAGVTHELGLPGLPAGRTGSSRPLLQRKCACGSTALGASGKCGECRKKRIGGLQTKLQVSEPGDIYELEADRVADQVMRMPVPGNGHLEDVPSTAPLVQRRVTERAQASAEVPPIVDEVLGSPGQPLDSATRAFFEPRFGHDFSHVRVHTDAKAAESAVSVYAFAYTVGQNVVFGAAQYSPATTVGQRLIAHELAHVVQQGGSSPSAFRLGAKNDHSEGEAHSAERALGAATGRVDAWTSILSVSAHAIQRRVRPENVTCHQTGLTNPDLSGDEAVATIAAADSDAVVLTQGAEDALTRNLADVRAGGAVDPDFDAILQEELGLTLTNRAHFSLVQQQINRFRRIRETLESGYLRYMCRGSTVTPVSLVGCAPEPCGDEFASSCPGNRLIVLCQGFWDTPDEQSATILHEPFHIWFEMARHAPNALKRADASCFESFALRVAGREAFASCIDHTAG